MLSGSERDKRKGQMALQGIRDAHDATLRDQRVRRDRLLDGTGAEAVRGDVDDVVAAAHDVHVAIPVDHARVSRVDPAAPESLQVAPVEALLVVEQRREARGRERRGEHDVAHRAAGDFGAVVVVYDAHVEAWHWFSGRAGADR